MTKKKLIFIGIILMVLVMGGVYAYFTYRRVSDEKQQLVMGDIYLNFIDGEDTINLTNAFPETNEEARTQTSNFVEFSIEGTNTSDKKDIYYEIKLIHANDLLNKNRLKDSDLKFDLVETTGDERKTLLNGVSFENINNIVLYIDKVNRNTTELLERTYELRMWISDEILISDTDINADYNTATYGNSYANVKVAVYGYYEWKPYANSEQLNVIKRENNNNFWSSEISAKKANIVEVNFINMDKDEINDAYENAIIKADMSSSLLKPIKGWLEVSETDSSKYVFNIASNDVIYLPSDSSLIFSEFSSLKTINFDNVSTREVTNMSRMFYNCTNLTTLNINEWDTSQVTTMGYMFSGCNSLTTLDLNNWDTGKVTTMGNMFDSCSNLVSLNISDWDTKNVTSMVSMFNECRLLSVLDVSKWNTSNLVNTGAMFNRVESLTSIDLSKWDMSKVTNTYVMFQYVLKATSIKIPDNLKVIDAYMFNHNYAHTGNTVTISSDVDTMGSSHMWYGYGTTFNEFIVEEGNKNFKTIDGILYSMDGTRLISVPTKKKFTDKTFEIPEGVTFITENCFGLNKNIETLILPNSYVITRYVEESNEAYNYDNVNYGSSLSIGIYYRTYIGSYVVKDDNPNYTSSGGCIYSKDGSELIAVPWQYNGDLIIKEGTVKIGQEAFPSQCGDRSNETTRLKSVHIPASVTNIESSQITALNKLSDRITITIDDANPNYAISDGKIVSK